MKNVEEMTLGEIKEHRKQSEKINEIIGYDNKKSESLDGSGPYKIGQKYLIRTVTFFYVGMLAREFNGELVMSDASWVADTGRYSDALAKGEFNEVEIIPEYVIIPKSGVIDAVPWKHELPKKTK